MERVAAVLEDPDLDEAQQGNFEQACRAVDQGDTCDHEDEEWVTGGHDQNADQQAHRA